MKVSLQIQLAKYDSATKAQRLMLDELEGMMEAEWERYYSLSEDCPTRGLVFTRALTLQAVYNDMLCWACRQNRRPWDTW